ncbi:MAG: GTP-binding protein [Candidatus Thorarchaeota archaeon]|nr:GTP-binding protein [Candidatus Thorarchaeota archaeon]
MPVYKCLLVGDANVGKSSLMRRILLGEFDPSYCATVGVDLSAVALNIDPVTPVILTVIDLGGQEDFSALRTQYYRGAHYALLVFDLGSRTTLEHLSDWYRGMNSTLTVTEKRQIPGMVVGNKADGERPRQVDRSEGEQFASSIGWPYIETSAKTGANVDRLFMDTAQTLYRLYPPIPRSQAPEQ